MHLCERDVNWVGSRIAQVCEPSPSDTQIIIGRKIHCIILCPWKRKIQASILGSPVEMSVWKSLICVD